MFRASLVAQCQRRRRGFDSGLGRFPGVGNGNPPGKSHGQRSLESYSPWMPGASVRNSAHGKGHEEGGSTYTKAGSSLRSPPGNSQASTPQTRVCLLSALCSHLHL